MLIKPAQRTGSPVGKSPFVVMPRGLQPSQREHGRPFRGKSRRLRGCAAGIFLRAFPRKPRRRCAMLSAGLITSASGTSMVSRDTRRLLTSRVRLSVRARSSDWTALWSGNGRASDELARATNQWASSPTLTIRRFVRSRSSTGTGIGDRAGLRPRGEGPPGALRRPRAAADRIPPPHRVRSGRGRGHGRPCAAARCAVRPRQLLRAS